jgi:pilus assembly protein CpaB
LSASYLAARAEEAEASVARRYRMQSVVVAAADVARGDVFGEANLALREIPQEFLPADVVPAERAGLLIGGRAAIDIRRGTPVVPAAMQQQTAISRLAYALKDAERALAVAVDDLSSLAGGLRAGDRVDLYFSRRDGDEAVLVPLLQQVEVLATGESFGSSDDAGYEQHRFATITLRLSSADAQRVLLAQQVGELSVLLRSPGDDAVGLATVRSSRELLRQSPQAPAASSGVELLTGGGGSQPPARTWLKVGVGTRGATP